eukprot:TRINITY_DN18195_c0_g1_i2.p1 TRINITY_DN18195_c0_g1~~TRINITY_DN18195_c0_g1_i2.p1  ORF type:complete len:226 (-),score=42.28 TRINITY_DN18195_c0_g1_i2:113-790(-)
MQNMLVRLGNKYVVGCFGRRFSQINAGLLRDQRHLRFLNELEAIPIEFGRDLHEGKRSIPFFSKNTLFRTAGAEEFKMWEDMFLEFLTAFTTNNAAFFDANLDPTYAKLTKRFVDKISYSEIKLDLFQPKKPTFQLRFTDHSIIKKAAKGNDPQEVSHNRYMVEVESNYKLIMRSRRDDSLIFGSTEENAFETHLLQIENVRNLFKRNEYLFTDVDEVMKRPLRR